MGTNLAGPDARVEDATRVRNRASGLPAWRVPYRGSVDLSTSIIYIISLSTWTDQRIFPKTQPSVVAAVTKSARIWLFSNRRADNSPSYDGFHHNTETP